MVFLLVSSGCPNSIPQSRWLKHRNLFSHSSEGWKPIIQVKGELVSGESTLPGLQMAIFLPCPQLAFHLCTDTPGVSPSSYKDMVVILIQSLAHGQLFATPSTAACQTSLILHYLMEFLKLKSIESVMPSNHLILYYALFLLPSIFPASGSFLMSWLLSSGAQSIGASASASVLPMNIQGWFPLGWTGLISLQSDRPSRIFPSTTHSSKKFILQCSAFFIVYAHIHTWLLEKSLL